MSAKPLRADVATVDRVNQSLTEEPCRAGHFQVQTGSGGGDGVDDAEPVGDQRTVEFPFVLDDVDEVGVLGTVRPVDPVVGHQDHLDTGLDEHLERPQVDLAQRGRTDLSVHETTLGFGVIADEMLGADADALLLQS